MEEFEIIKRQFPDFIRGLSAQFYDFTKEQLKEFELNVIFPEWFKAFYRSKQNELFFGQFQFWAIKKFEISNKWVHLHPFTCKAVLVGHNMAGDFLYCTLEENSDYQLAEGLCSIWHETGALTVY